MKNKSFVLLLCLLLISIMSLSVLAGGHIYTSVSPANNTLGIATNKDVTLSIIINSTKFEENSTINATIYQLASPTGARTALSVYTDSANLSTFTATIPYSSLKHSTTYYWQVEALSYFNKTNSTVYQFSTRTTGLDTYFIGMPEFGTEIGGFVSNLGSNALVVILYIGVIILIVGLFSAIVLVLKSKIEMK
jgi:hypothetical protein